MSTIFDTPEWEKFARSARRAVGYSCERCKVRGKRLSVCHKYKVRDKLPKMANVLVLCDVCKRSLKESGEIGR
jgi:hypothetical protein